MADEDIGFLPVCDGERLVGALTDWDITVRAIAKGLDAKTTRPNDLVAHEDRRDLRGLGVFASWVNNRDAFQQNTLDMYQGAPGKGHVMRYQQDLGGSYGNYGGQPSSYWMVVGVTGR